MPLMPSGLYSADGFVIISMRSMPSAGNWFSASPRVFAPIIAEGLPFISIVTLLLPRRLTAPSISTSTDGMFCMMSLAEPDVLITSCPTLYTFRSSRAVNVGLRPCTTTSPSCSPSIIYKVPMSAVMPLSNVNVSDVAGLQPTMLHST